MERSEDRQAAGCLNDKRKNALGSVLGPMKETVNATMDATCGSGRDEGMVQREDLADRMERLHPSAAGSLRTHAMLHTPLRGLTATSEFAVGTGEPCFTPSSHNVTIR